MKIEVKENESVEEIAIMERQSFVPIYNVFFIISIENRIQFV